VPQRPNTPSATNPGDSAENGEHERQAHERERIAHEARDVSLERLAEPIYFAYDRSALSPEITASLEAKLDILRADDRLQIRIEGHADDRGSGEYNIALGHRRAASVRNYLVNHGISSSRIEIMSFGGERPVCTGVSDDCWRLNRRAEVVVVAPDMD
jgi:peptidoglycan-associated lipoprotein